MGSISAAAEWTAEDDVVLKSAVEAGASLESLAKGAVCFSHKFTLQDLQDRWYSLLYDPEMSVQASTCMAKYETELLTSNPAKGSHQLVHTVDPSGGAASGYGCVGGSYADRQPVQSNGNGQCPLDMENTQSDGSIVLDGDSNHGSLKGYSDVDQLYGYDYMQKNPQTSERSIVSTDTWSNVINQNDTGATGSKSLPSIDQDGINHDQFSWNSTGGLLEPGSFNTIRERWCSQAPGIPTWSKLLGVSSPELTDVHRIEQETPMLYDGKMEMNENDALAFHANLDGGMSDSGLGNAMVSEGGLMHSNLYGDSEKEDLELLSSEHVLDSARDTNQEDLGDSHTKVFLKGSSRGSHLPCSDTANCGSHIDPIKKKHNVTDVSGADTIPTSEEVLYSGCVIKCTLNTQDSEIPLNDHIPIPGQSSLQPTSTLDQDSQHDTCLVPTKPINMENVVPSPPPPPTKLEPAIKEQKEIMMSLNEGCIIGNVRHGIHFDFGGNSADTHSEAFHSVDEGEETTCGLFQLECCGNLHNLTLDKSIQVPDQKNCKLLADKSRVGSETAIQSHAMSHALQDTEFHNPIMSTSVQAEGSDSEDSVPDYFDLEALVLIVLFSILDQDLIPWDQESDFIQPEVSRFHSPESRKDLIRLEKGACSYMNRSIMSKGAFAIIYGQHLRYYIRDAEVTLGRETEEAVIKMDDGGSFYMKNIGKGSVVVNGKEVPCNKRILLSSDSLIEKRSLDPNCSERLCRHGKPPKLPSRALHGGRGLTDSKNTSSCRHGRKTRAMTPPPSAPVVVGGQRERPSDKTVVTIVQPDNRSNADSDVVSTATPAPPVVRYPGWKAMPFVLGNETFEKAGSIGAAANLVVYLTSVFHVSSVRAAVAVNALAGTTNLATVLGALASDLYLGRFATVGIGCVATLIGMVVLTLTAGVPALHPPPCAGEVHCAGATRGQLAVLVLAFAFIVVGAGGIRPCSLPFGADQFDPRTARGRRGAASFFNWYYFTLTVAVLASTTGIVYVQTRVSWRLGFALPAALMLAACALFFSGAGLFVRARPDGTGSRSPLAAVARVFVTAFRNRRIPAASLFRGHVANASVVATRTLPYTDQFRFLDKAAAVAADAKAEEVEEAKCMLRVLPVWATCAVYYVAFAQTNTYAVLQPAQSDRNVVGRFEIPAASFTVLPMLALAVWVPLYDRLLVPFLRRRRLLTLLQRMGAGMALSLAALGVSEALNQVAQAEFYYAQLPEGARAVAGSLLFTGIAVASYLSGVMVAVVQGVTADPARGVDGWLAEDLNRGRLDCFYLLIGFVGAVNFGVFLVCAKWYRYKPQAAPPDDHEQAAVSDRAHVLGHG
ncbi:hypothetical protein PR202_ga28076 [Eleusine coracana subsp. coracana]|uniref:Microspherule protein N-terminal domain-containing protein n=1 Tax=Eleusine coracana subsp. coracana TaxID=191504 RepID=A0AAV5DIW0_ELECO|nr:hypothetical protein PR202_ga28076 [Eleusine coracana subsp. coracana]